jgi:hypothetical protein
VSGVTAIGVGIVAIVFPLQSTTVSVPLIRAWSWKLYVPLDRSIVRYGDPVMLPDPVIVSVATPPPLQAPERISFAEPWVDEESGPIQVSTELQVPGAGPPESVKSAVIASLILSCIPGAIVVPEPLPWRV